MWNISMKSMCIKVIVCNGNFEILSGNFSFKPRYNLSEFLQISRDAQLKSEFLTAAS